MNSTSIKSTLDQRSAALVGPLVAVVLTVATSSVRGQVGASNIGIALAIVVVVAALISRVAGLITAGVAALGFNFFHTVPYHSLRVADSSDVVIVALLAVLGIVVSDFTAWRQRRETLADRHRIATDAPQELAELLANDRPVDEVWPAVVTSIMDQLSMAECRLMSINTDLPLISRTTARHAGIDDGFVLPSHGAALPLVWDDRVVGYLILRPKRGITSLWVERRVALAMADHLTIAITYAGFRSIEEQING